MKQAHIKYISGLILFGLNGIVSGKILLSSYNIVFFRTLLGSIFLLALCFITKTKFNLFQFPKQMLFIVLSGISMGLSWIFLYEAYRLIGVGLSSVTYYCGPVIVMLCIPLLFKKKLRFPQIACFAVVFIGILLISLPDAVGSNNTDSFGLICGFASAVFHALMVIFTMKAPDISGIKNSTLQLVISFITISIFVIFCGSLSFPAGITQWGWVLFLGIVNTGVGCYLYFSDIANLPVTVVSILGYLEPLSAVMFAILLLHESLSLLELIGAILILFGAIFSELFNKSE